MAASLLILLSAWSHSASGEATQKQSLDQLINSLAQGASNVERKKAVREVFQRGKEAIPALLSALEPALNDKDALYSKFSHLWRPLVLSGGSEEMIKVLKPHLGGDQFSTITKDARINSMKINLCTGLVRLADPDCEALLLNYLERTPLEQAVYTFGVSRDKKYLPQLDKPIMRSGPECFEVCKDLRRATYWIKVGPLPQTQELNNAQRVRQLIFEYMFIGSATKASWAIKFLGQEPQEFYGYDGNLYYPAVGEEGRDLLREKKVDGIITFEEVIFNPDQTRSYTNLGYYWGPRAGRGYVFLLEKISGQWQFTVIWPSWRS